MKLLVTGSAGHLGEGLMRTLRDAGQECVGLDRLASPSTDVVGSIVERDLLREVLAGVDAVLHAATLHKPHVATHSKQAFVDVNVRGTLNLLEQAAAAGVSAFVFTSTTSTFGRALVPGPGEPAAWITEDTRPVPKNIYGVTKCAAEDLCQLAHQELGLACVVLKTSRFFPELDDDPRRAARYSLENLQLNELLHRRVDLEDVVDAHLLAARRAPELGFARFVISATPPFEPEDAHELRRDAQALLARRVPDFARVYARLGWHMFPTIERVYANTLAREVLGWSPRHDFASVLARVALGESARSELARAVGSKGYEHGAED